MNRFAYYSPDGVIRQVLSTLAEEPPEIAGLTAIQAPQGVSVRTHHVVDGEFVEGLLDTRSLETQRRDAWVQIKAEREARMNAPITVQGLTLDADAKSRENLMGAVLEMQATGRAHRQWTLANNSRQNLTMAQLVAIGSAIADRTESLQNLSQDLREQIEAAETAEEVEAIVWPG